MTHGEIAEAYQQFGHLVLRRCQRILRGDAAAEDMLQEVFVRLWRFGDAYRGAESKLMWLYRVADRCCFDQLGRHSRRAEQPLDCASDLKSTGTNHGQAVEDREIIFRFLDRFDDRVKQVAVFHYLDEMTQEEIAQATGWSRKTVIRKLDHLQARARGLRASLYGEGGRT